VTKSTDEAIREFLQVALPESWFSGPPQIQSDEDEILCIGTLPAETTVERFRESTRQPRVEIARQAERRFGRTLSWGVIHDGGTTLFTTQALPVMTRLRLPERAVLQTLIDGNVARSKSEALAWCVQLVARHQADWLAELREALSEVEQVRVGGPTLI
jgi:hypothetical protein